MNPKSEGALLTPADLLHAAEILEMAVSDRALLAIADDALRVRLMTAAGRFSRPLADEARRERRALARRKREAREAQDRETRATAEIRQVRSRSVYEAPLRQLEPPPDSRPERILAKPKTCYVCKQPFVRLHFFYDALCPDCATLNWQKRFQSADLRGRVVLITGSRVKIGHHVALMCLRAGATVIATTRFPRDSALRFSQLPDFVDWQDRLHVHGLDLRHPPSVEIFARYVDSTVPHLDFLVNNAAQTVRRPTGFFVHLLEGERRDWKDLSEGARRVLGHHEDAKAKIGARQLPDNGLFATGLAPFTGSPGIGVLASAELSQVPCTWDDETCGLDVFPQGRLDADLQQVDTRAKNSWRLTLAEVPTPEVLEVQLVNSIAPYILCARLRPAMARNNEGRDRHIVNVTAMEGVFARGTKTDKHPHTNMAKAALDMMTFTSAPEYAADGIHMNAIDTGWVTDEDPLADSLRKQQELDFQPPLDIVDGAARLCDPFFVGLATGDHVSGKFLKDYRSAAW